MIYVVANGCIYATAHMEKLGFNSRPPIWHCGNEGHDGWYCVHNEVPFLDDADEIIFVPGAEARDDYERLRLDAEAWSRIRVRKAVEGLIEILGGLEN